MDAVVSALTTMRINGAESSPGAASRAGTRLDQTVQHSLAIALGERLRLTRLCAAVQLREVIDRLGGGQSELAAIRINDGVIGRYAAGHP